MAAAKVAVLTQTLELLPPPRIFGKIPKYFILQFELFSVLALDRNRIYMHTYSIVKLYLLLGCPTP